VSIGHDGDTFSKFGATETARVRQVSVRDHHKIRSFAKVSSTSGRGRVESVAAKEKLRAARCGKDLQPWVIANNEARAGSARRDDAQSQRVRELCEIVGSESTA
jgi:hypothetical protein